MFKNFQQTLWPQDYGCTVNQPRKSFYNLRFLQNTRVMVLPLLLNMNCFFLHSVAKYNSVSLLMLCYFQVVQYFLANVKLFLFKANISLFVNVVICLLFEIESDINKNNFDINHFSNFARTVHVLR